MRMIPKRDLEIKEPVGTCPEYAATVTAGRSRAGVLWIIAVTLAGLLLIAGVAFAKDTGNSVPGETGRFAGLAPAETDLFVSVTPDLKQIMEFTRIASIFLSIPEVAQQLEAMNGEEAPSGNQDYLKDAYLWFGGGLALIVPKVDLVDLIDSSSPPHFLVAASSRDAKQAKAYLQRISQQNSGQGSTYKEKIYSGVSVSVQEGVLEPWAYAVTQDLALLSNNEDLLCRTIDRIKNSSLPRLSESEDFVKIISGLPESRSMACYAGPQALSNFSSLAYELGGPSLIPAQELSGMGLSLSFVQEGVRLDYVTAATEAFPYSGDPVALKRITELLPSKVLAFVGESDLRSPLETIIKTVKTESTFRYLREELDQLESSLKGETGLDLEADILPCLNGVAAVAFLPDDKASFEEEDLPFDQFIMIIGITDEQRARNVLGAITNKLFDPAEFQTYTDTVNGQPVQYFEDPQSETTIGFALCGDLLFIGTPVSLQGTMQSSPSSLMNSQNFVKATASLPYPRASLFYLNLQGLIAWLDERQPFLKPIKTISVAQQAPGENDNLRKGATLITVEAPGWQPTPMASLWTVCGLQGNLLGTKPMAPTELILLRAWQRSSS